MFSWQVVRVDSEEIIIPPRQRKEVNVVLVPRKINPNYSRTIQFTNLKNDHNKCVVEVTSSNMDANHVTFHSQYYQVRFRDTPIQIIYLTNRCRF